VAADRLDSAGQSDNPLAAIFDKLIGRDPVPVLIPFGVLEMAMPGGPQPLEPGATYVAAVALKLPANLSPSARYHTFAPVYASDLHIVVVTAVKSPALLTRKNTGAPA
jgi:hypothetical protein